MVRSMIASVAGLRTHQSKMDVIGNNIANVNTWGFKSSSFNFIDSMYTNSINSSGGDITAGASGGRNASQVGYGTTIGSISSEFGTGAPSPSSNPLDCMIDGTGFFMVGSMVNGEFTNVKDSGLSLSRVGIFRVDENGYLVDDQRNYVYGYAVKDGTGIPEKPATAASYTATGADVEYGRTPDGNGKYRIKIAGITIGSTHSEYEDQVQDWIAAVGGKAQYTDADGNLVTNNPFADYYIGFTNYQGPPSTPATETKGTVDLTITKKGTGDDTANAGTVSAGFTFLNAGGQFLTTNAGNERIAGVLAEYADVLTAIRIPTDQDTGNQYDIQSYRINEDGTVIGTDKENRIIAIGQLGLCTVENPNGLEKKSGYYYTPGANAGDVQAMKPNGGPSGKIMGGYLEMANVDLANEFSSMITTQRGFQANSKIITVTDQMLEELVNMKR